MRVRLTSFCAGNVATHPVLWTLAPRGWSLAFGDGTCALHSEPVSLEVLLQVCSPREWTGCLLLTAVQVGPSRGPAGASQEGT